MRRGRIIAGMGFGALVAAGIAVAPMLHAQEAGIRSAKRPHAAMRSGIGTFTPSAGDPRLAAVLERAGLAGNTGFRFTPSDSRSEGRKSVTVAVRARSSRGGNSIADRGTLPAAAAVSIAPIAYNLGVSVGWKRFALAGDVARVDLGTLPGSRETADVGVSYTGKRVSGRVKAGIDRPTGDQPALVADAPAYSVDLGGSYSLSRNLDVTAGVRYKAEDYRARLPRLAPSGQQQRDSQAVYVGTAFRF